MLSPFLPSPALEVRQDAYVFNPSIPGTISPFLEARFQPELQHDGLWENSCHSAHIWYN